MKKLAEELTRSCTWSAEKESQRFSMILDFLIVACCNSTRKKFPLQEEEVHRRVSPHFGFSFTVGERILAVCEKNSGQRFDVQTCLLQHELHKWRSEYNCHGYTDFTAIYRYETEDLMLPHTRASSRRGYNPDGSRGSGPFFGDPIRSLALAGSTSLFGRRRFGEFSG
ncbi:hypothetical protein EVAR_37724_1 [Eumeta japonica]|uniref:Uncharacterized protein n=1 Tax=Eumeta variegata TaxID=151549 RepID=A0A4C1YNC0_EUMVA|nr:hypothetical protein EVAR_37724_1 [Eumeta japonica]